MNSDKKIDLIDKNQTINFFKLSSPKKKVQFEDKLSRRKDSD